MYKISQQNNNKVRNALIKSLIVGLIVFAATYFLTYVVMNAVFGYNFTDPKGPYYQVMNVTKDAAIQTEGYGIDAYITQVKASICETVTELQQKKECYAL